jgi:hypothetical protein
VLLACVLRHSRCHAAALLLRAHASKNLERSSVVDTNSGASVVDMIRTSSGTFLRPNQDDIIARIQQRIAELSMIPVENQEAMQARHALQVRLEPATALSARSVDTAQVLHYGLKEKYGAHMDTFFDARHIGAWLLHFSGLHAAQSDMLVPGLNMLPQVRRMGSNASPRHSCF